MIFQEENYHNHHAKEIFDYAGVSPCSYIIFQKNVSFPFFVIILNMHTVCSPRVCLGWGLSLNFYHLQQARRRRIGRSSAFSNFLRACT